MNIGKVMRDPEDLKTYTFVGRLALVHESSYLRVELLQMIVEGTADLESRVQCCQDGKSGIIAAMPSLLGEARVSTFSEIKRSIAGVRQQYLDRQIPAARYIAARDAAFTSNRTSARGMCEAQLEEILPEDPSGMLSLERRVSLVAEIFRKEIASAAERKERKTESDLRRIERGYQKAAARGMGSTSEFLPARAYVAAALSGLGIMYEIGVVVGPVYRGGPDESQVGAAIGVGILATLARGPLIAAVATRNPGWRSRAAFTIASLVVLSILGFLVLASTVEGQGKGFLIATLGVSLVIRLGWLAFWAYYLDVFRHSSGSSGRR